MKKSIVRFFLWTLFFLVIIALFKWKTIDRLFHTMHLFDEDVIVQNFQNMHLDYPTQNISKSDQPFEFTKQPSYALPSEFTFKDDRIDLQAYLNQTRTEGLLVIHNDTIVLEQYDNDLKEDESHISWSMSKSLVALMLGIAYDKGLYSPQDEVTKYLPQFKGTAYDKVKIEDLLQMSSGVKFDEDYGDFNSDINKFGRAFAKGSSLEGFAKSLQNQRPPGTFNHYVSIDTQVLGILLIKLTGKSLTQLTKEWIWDPLGMEHDAQWIVDNEGLELALGGLNATLRDYAKLGAVYLKEGIFNNKQIVSKEWINKSLDTSKPHLQPNQTALSSNHHGYGYQIWVPQIDEGDFFMVGIYNQFVYMQPKSNLLIAKLSANHHFKTQGGLTKDMHLAMFKRIAQDFAVEDSNQEI